ncbi:MAG TPA: tetratricopeptide repeat protein [Chthoniobacterales bacterium]
MKLHFSAAAALALMAIAGLASAQPAALAPALSTAVEPAREGVPEVTVVRLRELLKKAGGDEDWRSVATQLVPALLEAHAPAGALILLDDSRIKGMASWNFWRGQTLAALHRWKEALPFFQADAANPASTTRAQATFGATETLRALGRGEEALQGLATLLHDSKWSARASLRSADLLLDRSDWSHALRLLDDMNPTSAAERKERRFLRARLQLVRHRPEHAIGTFESLVKKPEEASHALILAALFAAADAHLQLKTPELGDDFLEDFIDRHPHDENLQELFAKLDELYRAERKPARVELEKWTREPEQPRRAFAQWYLARIELRAGHRERALQLFGELRRGHARVPGIAVALLEFARLTAEEGHADEAIAILSEARALPPEPSVLDHINMLEGELHYGLGRFDRATDRFEEVARSPSPLAAASRFNASLGWLQVGDQARFLADERELAKGEKDSSAPAELGLAEGLVQAAKGDKAAAASLQKFVRDHPDNPRVAEAWVALAELAFHATPPRIDEARKNLEKARATKPNVAANEQADYLTIWLEDTSPGQETNVIDRASRFLAQHPMSRLASDVRLKLAETYYRRQDFANAQTQFETLAGENPTGTIAEKALFFAAESAMSTMGPRSLDRAIELFDRVVQMKSEMRWSARNEQAVIERRLGKPQDALLLYEEVLKGETKPNEKREALCGKGDIYFELGSQDPKNFDRAIESYDQLVAQNSQPGHWRNQALFKKGVCLEKKADRDGALSIFYQVMEEQARPDRPPEFFWFYKAGFNAARLLEDAGKWESAASVYEKLAAAAGTRSEEAQGRLSRLRLEHFLWGN